MNKKSLFKHLSTGVWVLVFAIIPTAILYAIAHLLGYGLGQGGEIGTTLLIILGGFFFIMYLIISGWSARMGVRKVR